MQQLDRAIKSFLQFFSRIWANISVEKRIQRFFEKNVLFDMPDKLKKVFLREIFDKKNLDGRELYRTCEREHIVAFYRIKRRLEFEIDRFSHLENFIRRFAFIYALFWIITVMVAIFETCKGLECISNLLRWISVLNYVFSFIFVFIASVFLTVANLTGEFVKKFYLKKALRLVDLVLDSRGSKIDN